MSDYDWETLRQKMREIQRSGEESGEIKSPRVKWHRPDGREKMTPRPSQEP